MSKVDRHNLSKSLIMNINNIRKLSENEFDEFFRGLCQKNERYQTGFLVLIQDKPSTFIEVFNRISKKHHRQFRIALSIEDTFGNTALSLLIKQIPNVFPAVWSELYDDLPSNQMLGIKTLCIRNDAGESGLLSLIKHMPDMFENILCTARKLQLNCEIVKLLSNIYEHTYSGWLYLAISCPKVLQSALGLVTKAQRYRVLDAVTIERGSIEHMEIVMISLRVPEVQDQLFDWVDCHGYNVMDHKQWYYLAMDRVDIYNMLQHARRRMARSSSKTQIKRPARAYLPLNIIPDLEKVKTKRHLKSLMRLWFTGIRRVCELRFQAICKYAPGAKELLLDLIDTYFQSTEQKQSFVPVQFILDYIKQSKKEKDEEEGSTFREAFDAMRKGFYATRRNMSIFTCIKPKDSILKTIPETTKLERKKSINIFTLPYIDSFETSESDDSDSDVETEIPTRARFSFYKVKREANIRRNITEIKGDGFSAPRQSPST